VSGRPWGWIARISFVLPVLLLSLLFSSTVAAQDGSELDVFRHRAVFHVPDPPDAPYHAHQSILVFAPGAEAPLRYHGGPGYITILEGELTLYEDEVENVYRAGDSVVETMDKLYKGGNYTDADTVLMVTYLVPHGEEITSVVDDPEAPEPPMFGPESLAETMYEFTDPPASFDLVHSTMVYEPRVPTEPIIAQGDTLLTIVGGELEISVAGETVKVSQSDALKIQRNQEYIVQNRSDSLAITMSTELVPDVHSLAPAAGATIDRTFAMWLFVMTASALFVVGSVLRLTGMRFR
jgi:quercetin dioxygenase-like cupin family protein